MIEEKIKTTEKVFPRPFQWYLIQVGQTDSFFLNKKSKISFSVTKLKFVIIAAAIYGHITVDRKNL